MADNKKNSIENVGMVIIIITLLFGIIKIVKELWDTDRGLFWKLIIAGTIAGMIWQVFELDIN